MSIGDRVKFKHWLDGVELTGVITHFYELANERFAEVKVGEDTYYSVMVHRLEKVG